MSGRDFFTPILLCTFYNKSSLGTCFVSYLYVFTLHFVQSYFELEPKKNQIVACANFSQVHQKFHALFWFFI